MYSSPRRCLYEKEPVLGLSRSRGIKRWANVKDLLYVDKLLLLLKKDVNTYEHSLRVGKLCKMMASLLQLDEKQTRQLIQGGCLHDIGKLLIPDQILMKDSALTDQEWKIMKQHPVLGSNMMMAFTELDPKIAEIILYHHERWNGQGYPSGLSGENIPAFARICAIIDAFDSMVSDRPYRKGLSINTAVKELLSHSGTQFDPNYVALFLSLSESFPDVYPFK